MISKIARLKAKKGFTLIEIIVVVAIIGILIAVAVPALAYDNRPTKAKAIAKDVFYNVQDIMASMKSAAPDGLDDDSPVTWYKSEETIVIYADVNDQNTVTSTGLITSSTGSKSDFATLIGAISTTGEKDKGVQVIRIYEKLRSGLENYAMTEDGMAGTLAAVCDNRFNITAAYWFENDITVALANGSVFSDNYRLPSGYICGAYPVDASLVGMTALDP